MEITLGWIVFGVLIGLTIMQSVYVWLYCRFVRSEAQGDFRDDYRPRVAVILCLRGSDPSLKRCLHGLSEQDYDNFCVQIVVDNEQDEAVAEVKRIVESLELQTTVHVLREHPANRSLKCSAIISAVANLGEAVDVIALIDADAVPDRNWLKDLIRPLSDPGVGASTGNRWFAPAESGLGSEVRKSWNAAAVAQMSFYQIPWGGSLAVKRSTISDCGLLERWSGAFCEDTMLTDVLKENGLRLVRVPNLILSNDESTTLKSAFHWIVRQMLTVRLYHRDWPLVLTHGLMSGIILVMVPVTILLLFLNSEILLGLGLLGCFLVFEFCNAGLMAAIESANLTAIGNRGIQVHVSQSNLKRWLAIPITQLIHPIAVLTAAGAGQVSWRGITYTIGPGNQIEMVEYCPFTAADEPQSQSIG